MLFLRKQFDYITKRFNNADKTSRIGLFRILIDPKILRSNKIRKAKPTNVGISFPILYFSD